MILELFTRNSASNFYVSLAEKDNIITYTIDVATLI